MKKLLAVILTMCMLLSVFTPLYALAEDGAAKDDNDVNYTEASESTEESYDIGPDTVIIEDESGLVSVSGIIPEEAVLSVTSLDELKSAPVSEPVLMLAAPMMIKPTLSAFGLPLQAQSVSESADSSGQDYSSSDDNTPVNVVEGDDNDQDLLNDGLNEPNVDPYTDIHSGSDVYNSDSVVFDAVYDIKLTYNGDTIQPGHDEPVTVRIQGLDLSDDPSVTLIHILDDVDSIIYGLENGSVVRSTNSILIDRFSDYAAVLDTDVAGECVYIEVLSTENGTVNVVDSNSIEFNTSSFSIYVVENSGPRLMINFYQESTKIASINVKKSDIQLDILDQVLYDPGSGELTGNEVFKGWFESAEYSLDDIRPTDNSLNIEDIRQIVEDIFENLPADATSIDPLTYYAMIFNAYSVTYTDVDMQTILYNDIVYAEADEPAEYVVPYSYISDDQDASFKGWIPDNPDYIQSDDPEFNPNLVKTETEILINHNVMFYPSVPKGHWIIYKQNGEGATYTAPAFVELRDVTTPPSRVPTRTGYSFDGWYDEPEGGNLFTFGNTITGDSNIVLYAHWTANTTAPYTIVIWQQNIRGSETVQEPNEEPQEIKLYDFIESITIDNGPVGSVVNTVTAQGSGNGRYARVNGENKQYTGFYLDTFDTNVTIVPEGTTIVNVYYDRIEYSVKFYYARIRNRDNNNDTWYVASAITTNQELDLTNRTTWSDTGRRRDQQSTYGPSTQYEVRGDYRYYYFTIDALYGQNISEQWPRYSDFPNIGNYQLISWWMMHSAGSWGGAGGGLDTVKGVLSVMDTNILGNPESSDGNFLIARFSNQQPNVYNYKIWKELPDGFDVPTNTDGTPKQTTTRNGVRYYLDEIYVAKANSGPDGIHQPSFIGFEEETYTYRRGASLGGGKYEYDVEMYYSRNKYRIHYVDGTYYYGETPVDTSRQGVPLNDSYYIYYEADIHSAATAYTPEDPNKKYVFSGWYTDKSCTHEASFTTLPGEMTVYAKWQEKEYRVFLHPNITSAEQPDPEYMGGQSTSFRVVHGVDINNGEPVIAIRDGYTLIGWYTDEACTQPYNFATVMNDDTVKGNYPMDSTRPTELDAWGVPEVGKETYNKDRDSALGIRFWITSCLDLYAKWRKDLVGSDGIDVIYDAGTDGLPGSIPEDPLKYLDQSTAISGHASVPSDPENKRFAYWQVMIWDETQNKYVKANGIPNIYPGDTFTVNIDYCRKQPVDGQANQFTYTMELQAVYIDRYKETTTVIFDANGGVFSDQSEVISREYDLDAYIVFPSIDPTRTGYEFLGWATTQNAVTPDVIPAINDYWAADNTHTFGWNDSEGKNHLYAVWKPLYISITISKSGMDADPGQRSVFDVYEVTELGDLIFVTQVTVNGCAGDSDDPNFVVVNGLTIGSKYRVVEQGQWSWRYDVVNDDADTPYAITHTITSDPDDDNNHYDFENSRVNDKWIDSYDHNQNIFDDQDQTQGNPGE